MRKLSWATVVVALVVSVGCRYGGGSSDNSPAVSIDDLVEVADGEASPKTTEASKLSAKTEHLKKELKKIEVSDSVDKPVEPAVPSEEPKVTVEVAQADKPAEHQDEDMSIEYGDLPAPDPDPADEPEVAQAPKVSPEETPDEDLKAQVAEASAEEAPAEEANVEVAEASAEEAPAEEANVEVAEAPAEEALAPADKPAEPELGLYAETETDTFKNLILGLAFFEGDEELKIDGLQNEDDGTWPSLEGSGVEVLLTMSSSVGVKIKHVGLVPHLAGVNSRDRYRSVRYLRAQNVESVNIATSSVDLTPHMELLKTGEVDLFFVASIDSSVVTDKVTRQELKAVLFGDGETLIFGAIAFNMGERPVPEGSDQADWQFYLKAPKSFSSELMSRQFEGGVNHDLSMWLPSKEEVTSLEASVEKDSPTEEASENQAASEEEAASIQKK